MKKKTPDNKVVRFLEQFKFSVNKKFDSAKEKSDIGVMRECNDLLIDINLAILDFSYPQYSKIKGMKEIAQCAIG